LRIEMTSANVVRAVDTKGTFHYRNTEHKDEFSYKAELDGINQLFSRNYTDFRYVYVEIYPEPRGFFNFIKRLLFGTAPIQNKRTEVKTQQVIIDSLHDEAFNSKVEAGRYELTLEHLKEVNPKLGEEMENWMSHETE